MAKVIKISQYGLGRINRNSKDDVKALYTDNLNVCLGIIAINKEKILLMHVETSIHTDCIARELKWVGDEYELHIGKSEDPKKLAAILMTGEIFTYESFIERLKNSITALNVSLWTTLTTHNAKQGMISVYKNGDIKTTAPSKSFKIVEAPHHLARQAINFLNNRAAWHNNDEPLCDFKLDHFYDVNHWNAMPELTHIAREIIHVYRSKKPQEALNANKTISNNLKDLLRFSFELIAECVTQHLKYETQIKKLTPQVNDNCVNLFKQQKFAQAEIEMRKLISQLNSIYDNQNELATARYNLGSVLLSQQKWLPASLELEQAIKLYQQTNNPTSIKKAQEKLAECKKHITAITTDTVANQSDCSTSNQNLKYIEIKTHGVMRINLKHPPQHLAGLCALPTPTGAIWLNAKSQTGLLSICTMLITNTDLIAQQLAWLKDEYALYYMVDKEHAIKDKDIKLLAKFFEQLKASLAKLKLKTWVKHHCYFPQSLISGFDFAGNFLTIDSKEIVEHVPFASARKTINHINLTAADQAKSHSQYQLDLQFDINTITPPPKFSDQGLFLFRILSNDNYRMYLFRNPVVNDEIRDLFCNPFGNDMHKARNKWLSDYEKYFTETNTLAEQFLKYSQNSLEEQDLNKALACAERALAMLKQFNEELVEAPLMQAYYHLGIIFFKQNHYQKAISKLEKAKQLSHQLGKIDTLQKTSAMLTEAQQKRREHSSFTLLSLPSELILRITSYLNPTDTGRFAQVSSYTSEIANNDYLWKEKLELDFTKSLLPQEERSYRKQYADYYLKIKQLYNAYAKQHDSYDDYDSGENEAITPETTVPKPITILKLAFEMGAEVQIEKLLAQGTTFSYELDLVEALLTSRNKNLLSHMLDKGLNIDQKISCHYQKSISIFHLAIFLAPDSIPQLLAAQPDITILPPLHVAVLRNDITKIKTLLASTENVDEKDLSNCTPLWWALMLNNFTATHLLLACSADISMAVKFRLPPQTTYSPHRARYKQLFPHLIFHNHSQCLELLLKAGHIVNNMIIDNFEQVTLLTLAMKYGKTNIVKLLLNHGAEINLDLVDEQIIPLTQTSFCEAINFNPLAAACSNNQVDCLKLIVTLGAKIDALEVSAHFDHKHLNISYKPPLFAAIEALNLEAVTYLLNQGADPNLLGKETDYEYHKQYLGEDINCLTSLLNAFSWKLRNELDQKNYNPEDNRKLTSAWLHILDILIEHKISLSSVMSRTIDPQKTCHQKVFWVELIKKGYSIYENATKKSLEFNQQKLILLVLRKLAAHNINIDLQDNAGQTALHCAVTQGYEDIVSYLVKELNAKLDIKDKNGETPIFIAARQTNQKLFKFLVKSGSNLDEKNTKNETPMEVITTQFTKRLRM